LTRIPQCFRSIQVCCSVTECDVVVRDDDIYLDSEQRAVHEAPRQQDRQCLLLPYPETTPGSPLCQQSSPEHPVTSLVLSRLEYCNAILAGLPASTLMPLQRAYTECRRPLVQHHNSSERSTLAAGQAPHHLQSRNSDAPSSSSSLSTVLG